MLHLVRHQQLFELGVDAGCPLRDQNVSDHECKLGKILERVVKLTSPNWLTDIVAY